MEGRSITVVGGGLVGSLMALYLGKDGHHVRFFERRPDIRGAQIVRGRSINLAISKRGLTALEEVGLKERTIEMVVPMRGRMMHAVSGELTFQRYSSRREDCIYSISRRGLNKMLIEEASKNENVELNFNQRCVDVDAPAGVATFRHSETGELTSVQSDLVVGADGAFSAVRDSLLRSYCFDFRQEYLEHGYLELNIPPKPDGGFRLEENALHIWPRQKFMMIALPNSDGSFTCTCFWPLEGEFSFGRLTKEGEVMDFFRRWFPDAVQHMPNLLEDFEASEPSTLVTVRSRPWVVGKTVLVGDAAHAVVPFYGQGMNAGFEDCRILHRLLVGNPGSWNEALEEYSSSRKPNCDALADLAIANFVEMRDHVASTRFLLKKKLEHLLEKMFPSFNSLYSTISFTNTPYLEAVTSARRQVRMALALVGLSIAVAALLIVRLSWN